MAFLVCLLFRESIGVAITKSFVIFVRNFFVSSNYIAIEESSPMVVLCCQIILNPPAIGAAGVTGAALDATSQFVPDEIGQGNGHLAT